jgi:hypothetical protein
MSLNFEEQRHVGKPGLSITSSTKEWNPIVARQPTVPPHSSSSNFQAGSKRCSTANQSFVTQSGFSTHIYSDAPTGKDDRLPRRGRMEDVGFEYEDEEQNVYPGPLPLTILIIGLCLSVFLISLDRTIITTVSPL